MMLRRRLYNYKYTQTAPRALMSWTICPGVGYLQRESSQFKPSGHKRSGNIQSSKQLSCMLLCRLVLFVPDSYSFLKIRRIRYGAEKVTIGASGSRSEWKAELPLAEVRFAYCMSLLCSQTRDARFMFQLLTKQCQFNKYNMTLSL